jgi:hypothetical protein
MSILSLWDQGRTWKGQNLYVKSEQACMPVSYAMKKNKKDEEEENNNLFV